MGHGSENQSQLSLISWLFCSHLSGLSDLFGRLVTPTPLLLVQLGTSVVGASQGAHLQRLPRPLQH